MVDQQALILAFTDYSNALLRPYEIGDVMYRLTDQVVEVMEADGAGVSLAQADDTLAFLTATDAKVAAVEANQEAEQEGPGFDAYRSGDQVVCHDVTVDTRWPSVGASAARQGWRAVAAIPMPAEARRIGVVDVYRTNPHDWSFEELQVGQLLGNMASGYVLNRTELDETREVVGQLQHALDSRIVIEQAKGIVAARRDVNPDEAFAVIRAMARSSNTRLQDMCRQIVDGAR